MERLESDVSNFTGLVDGFLIEAVETHLLINGELALLKVRSNSEYPFGDG
jgi:hypothetical protein